MIPLRRTAERPEPDAYDPPAAPASTLTLDQRRTAGGLDARKLQDRARAFAAGDKAGVGQAGSEKWTARRTLAFAVGASLLLWGGIFMMGWAVLRSFS